MEPILLIHGGAGAIKNDEKAQHLLKSLKTIVKQGYEVLKSTDSALDAVEYTVRLLEDDELFNAGKGSVLNLEGEVEMDASIMNGSDLKAGAVTVVKDVKNPITLARLVMEKTTHILLAGDGARKFAVSQGVEIVPDGALVTEGAVETLQKIKDNQKHELGTTKDSGKHELGTVGAVAINSAGQMAAATSTGGRQGKMVGRSSDTCMIGSGTYADDAIGAVSTTGHGETIAKFCLAHAIIKTMEQGVDADTATKSCILKMTERLKNTAGAITLSKSGDVGIGFSTNRMTWAYQRGNELHFGVDKTQHDKELL